MNEDRLRSLLLAWQQQQAEGSDAPPAELCHDCPELAEELHRRIEVLRQMNALMQSDGGPPRESAAGGNASPETVTLPANVAREDTDATVDPGNEDSAAATTPAISVPGYEILQELGRGGMGVVYLARHRALKRLVALKMIRGGASAGPKELARFRTEAEAIARLQHVNIVQIFEVGEHDSLPFFALEYCAGGKGKRGQVSFSARRSEEKKPDPFSSMVARATARSDRRA